MPYDFGLVQTIDGLGHGIVIRISDAADGGVNIRPRQTLNAVKIPSIVYSIQENTVNEYTQTHSLNM